MPRLELSLIEINSITEEKTDMTVNVTIKNQIPFSFTADSLQYKIFINGTEVMQNVYRKSIILKGSDSSQIALPFTVFNRDLLSVLKTNAQNHVDSVEYRLQLSFFTPIMFRKKIDVEIKKVLPLVHLLELKVEDFKIDSLNFSRGAIQLLVSVKNENIYPIEARNIGYEFSIEDHKWVKGIIPGLTIINPKSTKELSIPLKMSFKEVGKTLFDILKTRDSINYKLRLKFSIVSENNMLKNSRVIIKNTGSIKSLIKTLRN